MIRYIFFDLHGTLIDSQKLSPCWREQLGRLMAARYGGDAADWTAANRLIVDDIDSYYADLDLGGPDGIADMWEGFYRTTRALFRLVNRPEPPKPELTALSRAIPGLVTAHCNALYSDVKPVIQALFGQGYVLGITSHALVEQARGLLRGGEIDSYFTGTIVGPDNAGQFLKDTEFFRKAVLLADVDPARCLVVDDRLVNVQAAIAAGMRVAYLNRSGAEPPADSAHYDDLGSDLTTLPDLLQSLNQDS